MEYELQMCILYLLKYILEKVMNGVIHVEKYKQMVTENVQMHYHLIELEEKKQKTREICSP